MKKQIARMTLLGATAGAMLVVSSLILPTVALSTDCADVGTTTLQPSGCQSQTAPANNAVQKEVRSK